LGKHLGSCAEVAYPHAFGVLAFRVLAFEALAFEVLAFGVLGTSNLTNCTTRRSPDSMAWLAIVPSL
jgi:hypothetical protein